MQKENNRKYLVDHDAEERSVLIKWGKLENEHCGNTEKIEIKGCTILLDRNRRGIVKAVEVLYDNG